MDPRPVVFLEAIKQGERAHLMKLLVIADESEEIVREYIDEGELFEVRDNQGATVGVVLMIAESANRVEIKNIAIAPEHQGKGYGKTVIEHICRHYAGHGFSVITVGTANSSIDNLAFYQKAGFRLTHIVKDFFAKYPEPIYEHGIRALDMVMLERKL